MKVTLHIFSSANPLDLSHLNRLLERKLKVILRMAKTINVLQMANLEAGHVASNAPKSGVHHHIV